MKPEIGISKEHLHQNIDLLASILADEIILQVKTRKFHWNVDGESFMELHLLFQNQIVSLEEMIDQVAERIGKLGGKTIGTLKEFLAITRLKESPDKYPAQKDMMQELLADHETVIVEVRKVLKECEKNKDAGTLDFLTGIIQKHETIAWVLRRYLK
jgi:starvation-inducible DNA-binding protein